jgi:hypothetical protein
LTRRGTVRRLCPHPLLHYCQCCHSIAHRAPFQAQSHASPFNYTGRRRGEAMMSGPLVNGNSQTTAPFQCPFIVLLRHGRGVIFNLQPSSSSPPSTSILVANLIPLQFQSSLPTSTLVAIQIPNPVTVLFPPLLLDGHGVLDATAAR